MSDLNILLVKQDVNMGDHGETVTSAVAIREGETVRELAERLLAQRDWLGELTGRVEPDWYLVVRLAEAPEAPDA